MKIVKKLFLVYRRFVSAVAVKISPVIWKQFNEFRYWENRKEAEGNLNNGHYEFFYTKNFGLDLTYYDQKNILDIGCGPRGSLEWATTAARRVGLDPLANRYIKLGITSHKMEYMCAYSENIPLDNSSFDVISSFNSLDHVENVEATISEIKRVIKSGGLFLLLVEIDQIPTDCEPHQLSLDFILNLLLPDFECQKKQIFHLSENGIYHSIAAMREFSDASYHRGGGYLSAVFVRR